MYIFNPDHDLALANFNANYTPPDSAIRMAHDLQVLPVWYTSGDAVVAEGEANLQYLEAIKEIIPLSSNLISYSDVVNRPDEEIFPWGWNPSLCKKLLLNGVSEEMLPSLKELQTLREYSNRKNAVQLLSELKSKNSDFCGKSYYFTEIEGLLSYLKSASGNKVLKMPVSGSGKGLIWILGGITDKQTDWCRRVIKNQGGVVAEPVFDKELDFAMEFFMDNGIIDFRGYSLFSSASSGAYVGNELLSDKTIENKVSDYVPLDILLLLREQMQLKLPVLFPEYKGYAGVDMMICNLNEGHMIHPCVEINMRMNMGIVSRLFHNQHMTPDSEGSFVVSYFKKPENALKFHMKQQQELPLKVKNGKVVSGYFSLTPVISETHYIAYVVIK